MLLAVIQSPLSDFLSKRRIGDGVSLCFADFSSFPPRGKAQLSFCQKRKQHISLNESSIFCRPLGLGLSKEDNMRDEPHDCLHPPSRADHHVDVDYHAEKASALSLAPWE
jgi:hypothetical protein